ncbi:MAG: hypothetical protein Q8Q14_10760 [Gemmatimonadales bacterium]|nr:hypothetical protein [Gemmatimonadales bacterium]
MADLLQLIDRRTWNRDANLSAEDLNEIVANLIDVVSPVITTKHTSAGLFSPTGCREVSLIVGTYLWNVSKYDLEEQNPDYARLPAEITPTATGDVRPVFTTALGGPKYDVTVTPGVDEDGKPVICGIDFTTNPRLATAFRILFAKHDGTAVNPDGFTLKINTQN